ncbi:MAG: DUF6056 family protein, partial [Elusimicrobiota bacterium]|nr:DUF6056 family protein [Elusimicrobiota bacterium]
MKQIPKQNKALLSWALAAAFYCGFIALLSALYPYGGDEYRNIPQSIGDVFYLYFNAAFNLHPRVGSLLSLAILYAGKWLFVLLNPLVQLGIISGIFYVVAARRADFKNLKDLPLFGLIALLSVTAVAAPNNTLFWICGAANYSWAFAFFILYLCLLRALAAGKNFVKGGLPAGFVIFILALALGISNENSAP